MVTSFYYVFADHFVKDAERNSNEDGVVIFNIRVNNSICGEREFICSDPSDLYYHSLYLS